LSLSLGPPPSRADVAPEAPPTPRALASARPRHDAHARAARGQASRRAARRHAPASGPRHTAFRAHARALFSRVPRRSSLLHPPRRARAAALCCTSAGPASASTPAVRTPRFHRRPPLCAPTRSTAGRPLRRPATPSHRAARRLPRCPVHLAARAPLRDNHKRPSAIEDTLHRPPAAATPFLSAPPPSPAINWPPRNPQHLTTATACLCPLP
jgi:hypothetical protein